jgi:hypothetical protein
MNQTIYWLLFICSTIAVLKLIHEIYFTIITFKMGKKIGNAHKKLNIKLSIKGLKNCYFKLGLSKERFVFFLDGYKKTNP